MFNLLASDMSAFDFGAIFGNIAERWYFYLALAVILTLLVLFFIFVKPIRRDRLSSTQKLVYVAVLTGFSVIANVLTFVPTNYSGFSVTITVCFVAGYLLGAKAGFAVGFIGDLIGGIVFPTGPYLPLMGLSTGLFGLIPAIIFGYIKDGKIFNKYVKTIISACIILVVCTVFLNTFSLWVVYSLGKKTFWAYLWLRLPWQVLNATVNCILCITIVGLLPKVLPKGKFVFNNGNKEIKPKKEIVEKESENESNIEP